MTVQKLTRHYRSLGRDLLCISSNNDFQQWVTRKYTQCSNHLSRFPALVFFWPFRSVITLAEKHLIIYPVQITVTAQALKSQTVLRETIPNERKIHGPVPFRSTKIIFVSDGRQFTMNHDGHENRTAVIHKQIRVMPNVLRDQMSPPVIFAGRQSISLLPRQNDERVFIREAEQLTDLSYLKPSAISSAVSKMVASPAMQKAKLVNIQQPVMQVQSLPTTSHATSIDINRLTDQVYQALERKIHLEKQRRGYR
jgi:hypothetical protein